MQLSVAIVVLVSVTAVVAHEDEPCRCYPDLMSGQVFFGEKKLSDFYMDFTQNKIVEEYNGVLSSNLIFYDLTAAKKYRFLTDGSCKVYDLTNLGNYAKCIPDDAEVFYDEEDRITYEYKLDDIEVVKTMMKDSCVPVQASKFKSNGHSSLTLDYKAVPGVANHDVFDVDVSNCH